MHKKKIIKAYYLITPFLIIGVSLGYTNFVIALLSLFPLLIISNRETLAIYLVMFGGPLAGVIRAIYPFLPIYGMLMVLFGLFLMRNLVFELVNKHYSAFLAIFLTLAIFGFFYLIGPRDSYAFRKYMNMVTHGFFMVISFYAFERSRSIDSSVLAQLLLVTAICMFAYVIQAVHIQPQGLFDYNWFRSQLVYDWEIAGEKTTILNYQQIGMTTVFALAVYYSQITLERKAIWFYFLCASQMVLVSGCRQAIVGVVAITAFRFAVFRLSNLGNKNLLRKMTWMFLGISLAALVFIFIAQYLESEFITNTIVEGDRIRERNIDIALGLFMQNPLVGVGIGGFYYVTGIIYPHNFFLELLSETGILGTIAAMFLLLVPLSHNRQGLLHINASNQFIYLILLGTAVRVMFSSDFTESIELFSAVFAITAGTKLVQK